MPNIRLFDIVWDTNAAGPAPKYRTEIYFAGCNRALAGNPCPNCCNPMIWSREKAKELTTEDVYQAILHKALDNFITLVGGEPTDQMDALLDLAQKLKASHYHIILFSWHSRAWFESKLAPNQLRYFDIIITEPYDPNLHLYTGEADGLHNAVGSKNQHLWCNPGADNIDVLARDINSLSLDENRILTIHTKEGNYYKLQQ